MLRAFTDPGHEPTLEDVEATIAELGPRFRGLLRKTNSLSTVWTFSKGSGWLLKIQDRRKALCYVIPHHGGFVVRGTVREHEREALSTADGLESLRAELASARTYSEGYLVQLDVQDEDGADLLDRFIDTLMSLRGL